MPRKPMRPCAYNGCPELTYGRYCAKHADEGKEQQREQQRRYNRYERDPEVVKKYDGHYRKLRELYINKYPLCEECLKHGRTVPAKEVHHIVPVKWGGKHSFENFMALCQSCHTKLEREIGSR